MSDKPEKTVSMLRVCPPAKLTERIQLNTRLPVHLNCPPWRLPASHREAAKINLLLEQSLLFQASTLPSEADVFPHLKHSILSNNALEVSTLLRKCISKLNVKALVICGLFKGPRGNAFPHVFLDIDGHIIDNSYTHLEEKWTPEMNMEAFVERFSQRKQLENYVRESPSGTKLAIIGKEFLGEKFNQMDINYLEIVCQTEMNQDKHLAMQICKYGGNLGVFLFDLLMRNFINETYGVCLEPVEKEMAGKCWSCGLAGEDLKTCTGCKIGMYCDKNCLQDDWMDMHKLMHKVWKNK